MRKLGLIQGAIVALLVAPFAMADGGAPGPAPAAGVVTTTDVKGHALHIQISGGIDIDGVWRSEAINRVLDRDAARSAFDTVTNSDSFFSPRIWLQFDAYMSNNVKAVIELSNKRLESDLESNIKGADSLATFGFGWGTSANQDVFGGGYRTNRAIPETIRQGYIQVDDFLFDRFQMRFGIQDFVVDMRNSGSPFLIGFRPDGAGKAFISPVQEAFGVNGSTYAYQPIAGAAGLGIYKDSESPGGVRFTYSADEHLHFDAWWFDIWSTGIDHYDELFYGTMAKYNIPDSPSCVQFLFDTISNDGNKNRVYTIGPGVDYWWDNLEMYGEFYYQWGDYGFRNAVGAASSGGLTTDGRLSQEAWAYYLGGRYNFECACAPYVDVQYAWHSGSNGDHDDNSDTNENFVSYSDLKDLMILEDHLYGLGVHTNYWKAQFQTGLKLSLQKDKDLGIGLTYAYAQNVVSPTRLDISDVSIVPGGGGIDSFRLPRDLGHEVDLRVKWQYSDSLAFDLGWAGLFDGNFWSRWPPVIRPGEDRTGDNMWMFNVGATVKF